LIKLILITLFLVFIGGCNETGYLKVDIPAALQSDETPSDPVSAPFVSENFCGPMISDSVKTADLTSGVSLPSHLCVTTVEDGYIFEKKYHLIDQISSKCGEVTVTTMVNKSYTQSGAEKIKLDTTCDSSLVTNTFNICGVSIADASVPLAEQDVAQPCITLLNIDADGEYLVVNYEEITNGGSAHTAKVRKVDNVSALFNFQDGSTSVSKSDYNANIQFNYSKMLVYVEVTGLTEMIFVEYMNSYLANFGTSVERDWESRNDAYQIYLSSPLSIGTLVADLARVQSVLDCNITEDVTESIDSFEDFGETFYFFTGDLAVDPRIECFPNSFKSSIPASSNGQLSVNDMLEFLP